MKQAKITITNETGLHARPANQFVQTASQFDSSISVAKGENKVDAKSILGILTLGAGKGAEIILKAEGTDEDKAIQVLSDLFESGLGE